MRVQWQRKRRRKRHRPAHAAPGDDESRTRPDSALTLALAPVDRADQVGDGEEPNQPYHDHDGADGGCVPRERRGGRAAEPVHDLAELQAHEHEQRGVQQEVEDVPDHEALQARAGRDDARALDAHVDAGGHGGEDPGEAEGVGGDECRVAAEE